MNGCDFFPGWLSRWDIVRNDVAFYDVAVSDIPYPLVTPVYYWFVMQYELDFYGCLDSELL